MVKCPYGEKKGFAVFCKLINKRVSPLKYPCTSDHYSKCPIYQEHAKEEQKVAPAPAPTPARPSTPPSQPSQPAQPVKPAPPTKPTAFKRPEEAENCYECIFYSELTKMCLKLKIRVDDPYNPPCKK